MWGQAASQIEAIHAMMSRGQRSVYLERHSLILWGVTAATLILLVQAIFTPELFTVPWQRTLASNSFITVVIVLVGTLDFRLTLLRREQRDETLSFVQMQLTKVWWSIIAMIVLINIGMNVFGGGYLFYPILFVLTGLGFYIHGLFSQQLLAWFGFMIILTGLGSISLSLPLDTLEWLAVFLFGLGLPLMAWLVDLPATQRHVGKRLLASLAWLSLVTLPTLAIHQYQDRLPSPDIPMITLQEYMQRPDVRQTDYVVRLPAGTEIPVIVRRKANTDHDNKPFNIPLILNRPLEVAVSKGVADGRYRVVAGNWVKPKRKYRLRDHELIAHIGAAEGIAANLYFVIKILNQGL